jgi:hypothetical protein
MIAAEPSGAATAGFGSSGVAENLNHGHARGRRIAADIADGETAVYEAEAPTIAREDSAQNSLLSSVSIQLDKNQREDFHRHQPNEQECKCS